MSLERTPILLQHPDAPRHRLRRGHAVPSHELSHGPAACRRAPRAYILVTSRRDRPTLRHH
eukprot:3187165-Pleurochrysis_carterae.AAC.3